MNHIQDTTQIQLDAERAIEVRRKFDHALSSFNAARERDGLPPLRVFHEGGIVTASEFLDSHVTHRDGLQQEAEGRPLPSAIRIGDVVTKIILVTITLAFIAVCWHAYATGAFERVAN